MKTLITVGLAVLLSGCVVTAGPYRGAVRIAPEPVVMYPQYESAYIYDAPLGVYFFMHEGRRYYMPHGWNHRQGYPKGHHQGNHRNDDRDRDERYRK